MTKKGDKFRKELQAYSEKLHDNEEPVSRKIIGIIYAVDNGMFATNETGGGIGFYPVDGGIVFDFLQKDKGDTFRIIGSRMLVMDNWIAIQLKKAIELSKELGECNEPDTDYIG